MEGIPQFALILLSISDVCRNGRDAAGINKGKNTFERKIDMTKDQFWQIIDDVNKSSFHKDQQTRQCRMTEALAHYSLEDILDWHLILTAYRHLANRNDLWAACTQLGAWDTDDGFSAFRSWLISRGKDVYMNALWDPRSLDAVPYEGEKLNFELFGYAAIHAYEAKLLRTDPDSPETFFHAIEAHVLDSQTIKDIQAEVPRQKYSGPNQLGHLLDIAFSAGRDIAEPQTMEELAETLDVAYGCVNEGGQRTQYVFHNTPENIASFIGSHPDAREIVVTDAMDWLVLNTIGIFINECPDQHLLEEIKKTLIPIQMGQTEPKPFLCPTLDEMDEYQERKNDIGMTPLY